MKESSGLFMVPFTDNEFVQQNRKDVLKDLHARLRKSSTALGQAIHGMGGVGKTRTSAAYAYRYREKYQHVLWVNAEEHSTLKEDFFEIAQSLGLPHPDMDMAVRAVMRWMRQPTDDLWLIIFDNADEPDLLKEYLPPTIEGRVLVTSRKSTFDSALNLYEPILLDNLPIPDAVKFLLERSGRGEEEREFAEKLAERVGGLPLALEQAAAYVYQTGARWNQYLQSFETRGIQLFENSQGETNPRQSVLTTWQLSIDVIEHKSPESVDLLRLCSFLAPDSIPLFFLRDGHAEFGQALSAKLENAREDPLRLHDLLRPLAEYSLIQFDREAETFSIHRLVQDVIQHSLSQEEKAGCMAQVIAAMSQVFPEPEFTNWSRCMLLKAHAAALAEFIIHRKIESEPASLLWDNLAGLFESQGEYSEAEPLYKQALEINRNVLSKEHPYFATSLNNLALLYKSQGKYSEAEPLYKQALEIRRNVLSEEHPDYATSLNNLAGLYESQGKYSEAEPLYKQALEIKRRALGEDHPSFATGLNNLAYLYRSQGRHSEAEPLYKQALEINRRALGEEHPSFATCLNNLIDLYVEMKRHADAEALRKRFPQLDLQ